MKPYNILTGLSEEVLKDFAENTFDSCVTDPPYGIRFMGKAWDSFDINMKANQMGAKKKAHNMELSAMRQFQSWTTMWAEQVYRVLKPGAYLVVFASPRTYHRMVCGIEDAGFEIRDQISWVFSSGFPKSSNQSGEWEGWGTALKPAHEPILIARKPLIGTIPQNLAQYRTGAINIKGSLIHGDPWHYGSQPKLNGARYQPGQITPKERHAENITGGLNGRWPANLIHDGSKEVLALFPESKGQQGDLIGHNKKRKSPNGVFGQMDAATDHFARNDQGSAARFFYCAKTSRSDRNEGLEKHTKKPLLWSSGTKSPGSFQSDGTDKTSPNNHPTVKPTSLMRYLCRLVTPPDGHILDPFAGSGSTGKGAILEGFNITLIDSDPQWAPIQQARCDWAINNKSTQFDMFKE